MADSNPLENERAGDQSSASLYEGHGNRTVRVHRGIGWNDVFQARKDLLGYAYLDSGDLVRSLPAQDADDTSLYCVRAEIRGRQYVGEFDRAVPDQGLIQTANQYSTGDIHATYESLPYDVGTLVDGTTSQIGQQPLVSEAERFAICIPRAAVEFVTAKAGGFQWQYDALPAPQTSIPYPIPERVPYSDLEVILFYWPPAAYPSTAIDACSGRVNKSSLMLPQRPVPWPVAEPETVQLLGAYAEQAYFPDKTPCIHIHYAMRRRALENNATGDIGWNVFPTPRGDFLRITRVADPTKGPFLTEEFLGLFQPEP
jgi:hypothetical protein